MDDQHVLLPTLQTTNIHRVLVDVCPHLYAKPRLPGTTSRWGGQMQG